MRTACAARVESCVDLISPAGALNEPLFTAEAGNLRALLQVLGAAPLAPLVLAAVVATQGSTYRKAGALILLPTQGPRLGWLSGGCLEGELELAAQHVLAEGRARTLRLDTRSDDDLVFGSASGCRGVVELLLLPLQEGAPLLDALRSLADGRELQLSLAADGSGTARDAARTWQWPATGASEAQWQLRLQAPPRLLLLGAGPESPALLQMAQLTGWAVDVVESRERWQPALRNADARHACNGAALEQLIATRAYAAAVVMSHHYARDLDYLRHCARSTLPWIGLLGPPARRDALLDELGPALREQLGSRLQAPVGLRLGGEGPEAIALAIVAALQRFVCATGS